jgi:hypothetical protein
MAASAALAVVSNFLAATGLGGFAAQAGHVSLHSQASPLPHGFCIDANLSG